jgi:branched-chain amino acid transport system permease protein
MSATTTGVYSTSYRADSALRRTRVEYVRLALLIAAVLAAPAVVSPYWLHSLDRIGIAVIGAVGLNILVGYTGQISLGQGGFLAVGAYTAGLISIHSGLPPVVGIVVAATTSAAFGAFFGLPALRLKGLYLAIATLASQEIIIWIILHWKYAGAAAPLTITEPTKVFGWTVAGDKSWYFVILAFAALAVIVATNLFRTGVGRAFLAIRDQDIAAEAMGVDTARYKIIAFAISSGFVGVAGALTAYWTQILTFEAFTIDVSIAYLAMVIIGGLGSVSGAVYGAFFILGLEDWLTKFGQKFDVNSTFGFIQKDLPAIKQVIFGLAIVLFLVFEPKGLARIWQRSKDYFRLWPFRY